MEFCDYDIMWTSPDGSLLPDSPLLKANVQLVKLCEKNGREPSPGPFLEGWMKDAGFEDVVVEKFPMPVGTWPADKRLVRDFFNPKIVSRLLSFRANSDTLRLLTHHHSVERSRRLEFPPAQRRFRRHVIIPFRPRAGLLGGRGRRPRCSNAEAD